MDIPGQQPVVVVSGLGIRQFAQHFRQPQRWFLAIGLGGLDQRVNQSARVRAGLRIREEPVLAPDHEWPDGVLTRIVVNQQVAVFYMTALAGPVLVQKGATKILGVPGTSTPQIITSIPNFPRRPARRP